MQYFFYKKNTLKQQHGGAMVEFAIIAPILILLLVGLIELGRFAHFSILTANAARAGVQYGSQNLVTAGDFTGMQTSALNDAGNISGLTATATNFCKCSDGSASTCLSTDCSTSHRLVYVQVDTTGDFSSLLTFPGVPTSRKVKGHAVMRVSQ